MFSFRFDQWDIIINMHVCELCYDCVVSLAYVEEVRLKITWYLCIVCIERMSRSRPRVGRV